MESTVEPFEYDGGVDEPGSATVGVVYDDWEHVTASDLAAGWGPQTSRTGTTDQ